MPSTPAAITTSMAPDITACAAKCSACCDEPHCRSIEVPGTLSGNFEAITALRATLWTVRRPASRSHDDVFDLRGIGAGALHQRIQHGSGEIDRMPARQASSLAAACGAGGGDDIGLGHVRSPDFADWRLNDARDLKDGRI